MLRKWKKTPELEVYRRRSYYKKLSLVVWYVKGSSKVRALQVNKVSRMTSDKEIAIANKEACTELAKVMLDFVAGNDYVSLVYGAK